MRVDSILAPQEVEATCLRKGLLKDLAMKILYLNGELTLVELSNHMCLGPRHIWLLSSTRVSSPFRYKIFMARSFSNPFRRQVASTSCGAKMESTLIPTVPRAPFRLPRSH